MSLADLSTMFNRALSLTLSMKKNLLVFLVLALSGLLVVFFRGLAWNAGEWIQLSLTFLPIFLCGGVLLSLGIFLIRVYYNDVKNRDIKYRKVIFDSWELLLGASYFAIPVILTYLMLWMLIGIFVLLKEIPVFGSFFSSILSFAPFVLNFGSLILCLLTLLMLFFVSPIIALKSLDRGTVFQIAMQRLEKDPFANIILFLTALLPLVFTLFFLLISIILTSTICKDCNSVPEIVLKWFFTMVPFTAFLSPAVIFFFNFAAEGHVYMQKMMVGKRQ